MVRFGPSGNFDAFYDDGYEKSIQMPEWLHKNGLSAYEYPFTRGKYLSDATAKHLGDECKKYNIELSVHGPYYINFGNPSDISQENNFKFLLNSLRTLKIMGGRRCVFHIGSQMKQTREAALANIKRSFTEFLQVFYDNHYENMLLCPETMGKFTQIGDPGEIFDICTWDKCLVPTLDFGHINCLMGGELKTKADFRCVFELGIEKIGIEKMKMCHIHFSKIKYNAKGEIGHLTFEDEEYGPNFEPMLECIDEMGLEPIIICESRGTQGPDSKKMCEYFNSLH